LAPGRGAILRVGRARERHEPAPADTHNTVQQYASHLRRALGREAIESVEGGYRLGEATATDVQDFERLVALARAELAQGDVTGARRDVDAAVGMWRGPALGELADLEIARGEAVRLEEVRVTSEELAIEVRVAAGDWAGASARASRLVEAHPLREGPVRLLATSLQGAGRSAEAVRSIGDFRRRLAETTGLEPSDGLGELEQQILEGRSDQPVTRHVAGYELRELIGEGAFGAIYLAQQPAVRRDVAIKVVRPELANDPEFVRRFEVEAQTVARLEHPHIVPLHDFWRDPSGAYLVMRYLAGGSAAALLIREGPLPLDQVGRIVEEIGAALAVAHDSGIIHRDVKPENILFDDVGNSYLADFGIAVAAGSGAELELRSAGSPLYVAPEQVRDGDVSPASDIYAFGVVIHELLSGRAPFADADSVQSLLGRKLSERVPSILAQRPELPPAVDQVILTATDPNAGMRFPSMAEMVLAFRAAASGPASDISSTGVADDQSSPRPRQAAGETLVSMELASANPYKGLAAFLEADAPDFHGRDALTGELLDHLATSRLLVVTGPSGSGKSSVVRAGVLPRLREQGVLVAAIVPGTHPLDELETALLRIAVEPLGSLLEQLTADARGLGRVIKRVLPDDDSELVLVIDQFEELFTLTPPERRDAFLAALSYALVDDRSRLRVVATLRADFYDRPLQHPAISEMVRENTVAVSPLSGEELNAAITRPAERLGMVVEPALVSELVSEVRGDPASLPMLQFVLTELYEQRSGARMTLAAYQALGGVSGALALRAEQLYEELNETGRDDLRRLATRLITPGEGTEDTRRRAALSELAAIDPDLIDRAASARLLTFDHDLVTREPTVEVAHEALIREWPRLRSWLDEDRDGLRLLRHLRQSADAWLAADRDAGELYRGGRLEAVAEWVDTGHHNLSETESDFLSSSLAARESDRQAEAARLAEQAQANRRLRALLAAVAVVAAVALIAGGIALQQRSQARDSATEAQAQADLALVNEARAEEQTEAAIRAQSEAENAATAEAEARGQAEAAQRSADVRRMLTEASSLADASPALALLVAGALHRFEPGSSSSGALQRALVRTDGLMGFLSSGAQYTDVRWMSPELLAARTVGAVEIWDVETRLLEARFEVPGDGPIAVVTAAGTPSVVAAGEGGQVRRLTVGDGEEGEVVSDAALPVVGLAVSPGGEEVAIARDDGSVELRDSTDLRMSGVLQLGSRAEAIAFGPEGLTLLVSDVQDNLLRLDARTGDVLWDLTGDERNRTLIESTGFASEGAAAITDMRLSIDGSSVLLTSVLGLAVHDTATGESVLEVPTPEAIEAIDLGDNEILLGQDIIDASTGETRRSLRVGNNAARGADIAPDGRTAALLNLDRLVLWSLDDRQLLGTAVRFEGATRAYLSPDSSRLVGMHWPLGPFAIWDLGSGHELTPPLGEDPWMAAWTPGGDFMTYELEGRTRVWDAEDFSSTGEGIPPANWGAYAPQPGEPVAVIGALDRPGMLRVYDIADGVLLRELDELAQVAASEGSADSALASVAQIAFDPSGELMAVVTFLGGAALYDASTWELVHHFDGDPVANVTFSHDSSTLAVQYSNGSIHFVDPISLDALSDPLPGEPAAAGFITDHPLAFGADDRTLVVGLAAGVRVWDLTERQLVGDIFPNETLFLASPAFDGSKAVTGLGDALIVWDLDASHWPNLACLAAGRNMTLEEWRQYGPSGAEYEAVCPQWPSAADN